MLKIGLIGLGQHGLNAVLPCIESNANWKLTAVADSSSARLEQVNTPSVEKFTDAQALIEQADVDAIYIATLLETHAPLTLAALKAGKHVVCEKPMAESAELCRQMHDASSKAGRILAVNFETRFLEHYQTIRQWVRDGKIGQLQAIHLQQFWDGHKSFGPLAERRHRLIDRSGGLDCGIHKIDTARYLSGAGDWAAIEARGAWLGENVAYPPHISILGQLSQGVTATLNASLAYAANIEPRPFNESLSLIGIEGVISCSIDVPTTNHPGRTGAQVCLYNQQGITTIPVDHVSHVIEIGRLLDELHACILDPHRLAQSILPTGYDGLQAQIAVEWAHQQALSNRQPAAPK